jgi:phosphoribosyl-AMP cyclohydrolase
MSSYLDQIEWNKEGLVPVIAQDARTGRVLMMAWANREAVETSVNERRGVYWSRTRAKLWRKGEESGNVQNLVELYMDCDNDTLCYAVEQVGGVACHTGRESCFFQRLEDGIWHSVEAVVADPTEMYRKA